MNEDDNKKRQLGIPLNWGVDFNLFLQQFSLLPSIEAINNPSYDGPQLNLDTLSEYSKEYNRKRGEAEYRRLQESEKNKKALGALELLSVMDPSRLYGAVTDNKPFVESLLGGNAGFGIPLLNFAVDTFSPNPTGKFKKGINFFKGISKIDPRKLFRKGTQESQGLMRRDLTKPGVVPYTYEEVFDEAGNLRPEVNFEKFNAGHHGQFYDPTKGPREKVSFYYMTLDPKRMNEDYANILKANKIPYTIDDRGRILPLFGTLSGWIADFNQRDFSPDSFITMLSIFERNLKEGRKFHFLQKRGNGYLEANPLNLKSRYNQVFIDKDFEKEFKQHLENTDFSKYPNINPIPNGYRVDNVGEDLVFSRNGKEVGRLLTRSLEDMIKPANARIQRLNKLYNMEIPLAKVEDSKIYWPDLYGVMLKRGGLLNKKFVKPLN